MGTTLYKTNLKGEQKFENNSLIRWQICYNSRMMRILIVEDDTQTRESLALYFTKAGCTVLPAENTSEARHCLSQEPDVILADISLPGQSGIEFCRSVQKIRPIPVIFLTARDHEEDILEGYEAGCQEYVTKPISPKILLKKLQVILKRNGQSQDVFEYRGLRIDYQKQRVWNSQGEISLTAREWKLLSVLAVNHGKIVTRERLLEKIWDSDGSFVEDHAVTVAVNRLRKKIEKNPSDPLYIKNIFGIGYTFGE